MTDKTFSKKPPLRLGLCALALIPCIVFGHAGENHSNPGVAVDSTALESSRTPLPIDVGGPFSLVDHHGNAVTDQTYAGKHVLVFFGYTDCQIMCSISLTRIGGALEFLQKESADLLNDLVPLVVTVDPQNDTPAKLRESLSQYHPALLGLTGTRENLKQIYQAYNQSPSVLDGKLAGKHVVTHSSYFHLLGPDGKLETFFPPVLNSQSMANILMKYIR